MLDTLGTCSQGTIIADNDPFRSVKTYYADAIYYKKKIEIVKSPPIKEIPRNQLQETLFPTPTIVQHQVTRTQRVKIAMGLASEAYLKSLVKEFIIPITKSECSRIVLLWICRIP